MEAYIPILKDKFRQYYQVIINHKNQPHPQSQQVKFWQLESAKSFLRNLNTDPEYWARLTYDCHREIPHTSRDNIYNDIATHILQHRIEFHKLPELGAHSTHDGSSRAYQFIHSPGIHMHDNEQTTLKFTNKEDVNSLLNNLTDDESYWKNVLIDNKLDQTYKSNETSKAKVASYIASGTLVVYQFPYTPSPPKSNTILEDINNQTPVPLGPHSTDVSAIIKKFNFILSS